MKSDLAFLALNIDVIQSRCAATGIDMSTLPDELQGGRRGETVAHVPADRARAYAKRLGVPLSELIHPDTYAASLAAEPDDSVHYGAEDSDHRNNPRTGGAP